MENYRKRYTLIVTAFIDNYVVTVRRDKNRKNVFGMEEDRGSIPRSSTKK